MKLLDQVRDVIRKMHYFKKLEVMLQPKISLHKMSDATSEFE